MTTQNGLSSLCPSEPSSLADGSGNPCSDESVPIAKTVWYGIIGAEYEKAISVIKARINWNISPQLCGNDSAMAYTSPASYVVNYIFKSAKNITCFTMNEVACVVNSYTNHASKKEYPAYNPNDKVSAKRIIETVKSDTRKAPERIELVLNHLFYGVKDGSVTAWQLLDPVDYEAKKGSLNIPPNVESGVKNFDGFLSDIGTYAKWGVGAIVGGVILYFGIQAISVAKTVKGAV